MAAGSVRFIDRSTLSGPVAVSAELVIADSLQTVIAPPVQQSTSSNGHLNPGDISVLDKISGRLIEPDKDALRQKLKNLKEEYENSKESYFAFFYQTKIIDYQKRIIAIQDLLNDWENQNNCTAKISCGYRQIMSKPLKTILSVEKLTSFEYDSHLLKDKIDLMIVINSNNPNGDKSKELKEIKQKFVEFLYAVDCNNITDEIRKKLCDYESQIECYPA